MRRFFGSPGGLKFLKEMNIELQRENTEKSEKHHSASSIFKHVPVMKTEVIASVKKFVSRNPEKENYFLLDCTAGTGGHSIELMKEIPNLVMYNQFNQELPVTWISE